MKCDDYLLDGALGDKMPTAEQVAVARTEVGSSTNIGVVDVLVKKGVLTARAVAAKKAETFGVEFIDLREVKPQPEALAVLSDAWAWCYQVFPIHTDGVKVMLAVIDPANLDTLDSLHHLLRKDIEPVVVAEDELFEKLRLHYPFGKEKGNWLRGEREDARSGSF